MAQETGTYLDRIIADKRVELAAAQARTPQAEIERLAATAPPTRPFRQALAGPQVSLIAEVKKASPSRGVLREDFDPRALATAYGIGGASAISVLTDAKHFQGSLEHLRDIRGLGDSIPPLLRKDFLFDAYQVYEARAFGADALLLIAAVLEPALLAELLAVTRSLGMDALIEVHDAAEVGLTLKAGADLLGVNNRDLRTFNVDLATTERLRAAIPDSVTLVAESGVHTLADVRRMQACGVNAILIGEALVTAADPIARISELFPHARD